MKKLLGLILVTVMALICFTACTNGAVNGNDGVGGSITENGETDDGNVNDSKMPEQPQVPQQPENQDITKMYITINDNKLEVTFVDNSSVDALVERLKQGDITYTASDYGDFEKVGGLGFSLPANDEQITTQAGDVILYSGNQLVLFYGSNSWSYTKIGRINGYSVSELRSLFGASKGSVQVTLSLS